MGLIKTYPLEGQGLVGKGGKIGKGGLGGGGKGGKGNGGGNGGGSGGGGGTTDPDFANVVLLMGFEGADGSTSFDDESTSNKTITQAGNTQIDTAQFKYGASSGYFDGTGDYLTVPDSDDFHFGVTGGTIECFVRPEAGALDTNSHYIFLQDSTVPGDSQVNMLGLNAGRVFGQFWDGTQYIQALTVATLSADTWYHIALTIDTTNDVMKVWIDGVERASVAFTAGPADMNSALYIGRQGSTDGAYYKGWLDEIRITKGVIRYTVGFTPPAAAFPRQ